MESGTAHIPLPDYRVFLQAEPGLTLLLTPDFRIVAVANGYLQATASTQEDLVGRDIHDIFPVSGLRESLTQVLETRKIHVMTVQKYDIRGESTGGERYWRPRNAPVLGAGGEVEYIIHQIEDLTELVRLSAQLHQSRKLEAIGRLAGGFAHDFNNLLTVIMGYSGILREAVRGAAAALDSVDHIEKAARRAATLNAQLLTYSRKQTPQVRRLDLNGIIRGMQGILQRLLGDEIVLNATLDSDLPAVKTDSGEIEQILMNLAIGARDAMPQGGRLTLSTRTSDSGAALTVSTTGEGANPRLATLAELVQQSGGSMTVAAEPGGGPTLTVMLPAAETIEAECTEKTAELPGAGTVLLVEDQEALRRLAHGILSEAGYHVLEARNGSEGLVISHRYEKPIDLLLSDVVMPGMTGPEMAARLRKERPGMMVLFMSGYDRDLIDEPPGGTVHCLAKPFTRRGLTDKVRSVLARRPVNLETGVEARLER